MNRVVSAFIYVFVVLGLVACGGATVSTGSPGKAAGDFLPNLEEYNSPNVESVANTAANLGITTAVLSQSPILAAQIVVIDEFATCLNRVGAVAMGFYQHQEFPQAGGMVAAVNQNRLVNIDTLMTCLNPGNVLTSSDPEFQPCYDIWEYRENGITYRFFYLGTAQMVCDDFNNSMPRNE